MNTPVIVSELSANHLGSLPRALEIVEAAAEAGADLFKVQTWSPGRMCVDRSYTLEHGPWAGRKLVELYEEAFLPWEWHFPIFARASELGMIPFSAAFDTPAVDFLETLGVDRHKVASFELTDLPLIRYMVSKGKPIIASCGMASQQEIWRVWEQFSRDQPLTLLKCTSAYPAPLECANLTMMADIRSRFPGCHVGLSDHSLGHEAAVVATALGATMIEKHLTLRRSDGGPDAGFSLEPQEFKAMVQAVRTAAVCLGEVKYGPQTGEDTTLRRGLWTTRDISEGESLRLGDNIVTARPALGLPPSTDITGRRASRSLQAHTPLTQDAIA